MTLRMPEFVRSHPSEQFRKHYREVLLRLNGDGDSAATLKNLFDANTILKADTDNTPEALTVGEGTIVGRQSGGEIAALAASAARSTIGMDTVSQAEAEAGTATTTRAWTAERVKQAIGTLGGFATFKAAKVSKTAQQTLTTATITEVTWETEDFDNDGNLVDLANNRFTIPSSLNSAWIQMGFYCDWQINNTGVRQLFIEEDTGGGFVGIVTLQANALGSTVRLCLSPPIEVSTGYKYRATAQHTAGGTLDIDATSNTFFFIMLLGT